MTATRRVGVFVGSLRKESFTRKVANAIVTVAPPSLSFEFVDIGAVSHYNQDLETSPPADWLTFRQKASAVDALLFVTPEYNRSVPGVLKNAIDVGSRPARKGALNGKPGAVVSVSPGSIGGFGANQHLRQSLVFLDVPTLQQPEAYVGGADKLFDATGQLINDSTREFLRTFISAFAAWIELNLAGQK
jgi:chromate reductase, NAD(P)H dehydrogenase (quinone)